jgi:hypothetical protein
MRCPNGREDGVPKAPKDDQRRLGRPWPSDAIARGRERRREECPPVAGDSHGDRLPLFDALDE